MCRASLRVGTMTDTRAPLPEPRDGRSFMAPILRLEPSLEQQIPDAPLVWSGEEQQQARAHALQPEECGFARSHERPRREVDVGAERSHSLERVAPPFALDDAVDNRNRWPPRRIEAPQSVRSRGPRNLKIPGAFPGHEQLEQRAFAP